MATKSTGTKSSSQKSASTSKSTTPRKKPESSNGQLEEFFTEQLKDIYWAEKALLKALPKMQKAATSEELQSAIEEHIAQTGEHVDRLEQVFELLALKPAAKKCEAMEGLIAEGESIVEETEDGSMTRDAAIIMGAQKIEHYEIATYGGLKQLALTMGLNDAADLLDQTLQEEKETDEGLTEIAENNINWEAEQEGSSDE